MEDRNAARSQMMFDASRKSLLVAYLLWFFLGTFGIHRFYLNRTGSGIAQLALTLSAYALTLVLVGFLIFIPVGIWWLVDAVLIPGITERRNMALADQLSSR